MHKGVLLPTYRHHPRIIMPTTFAISDKNDFVFGSDGNLLIVTGLQAVLMACKGAAQAQLGEMVLAVNQGVPNFNTVWNGSPNLQQFSTALRTILLQVPGVLDILELEVLPSGDNLFYRAVILADDGSGELQGTISG